MSSPRDTFDLLAQADPVDEQSLVASDSEWAEALLSEIVAQPHGRPATTGVRPLKTAFVLAVLGLVSIAATWLWTRPVELPDSVLCYESVSLDADIAGAPLAGEPSADACAAVWRSGELENPSLVDRGGVPPLTACIAESGALAVFPSDDPDLCGSMGLPYPEPSSQGDAAELRRVAQDLVEYFQSLDCVEMAEAEAQVRHLLDKGGLQHWDIRAQPATDARPCASHSFDPDSKAIHLIPIPDND